MTEKTSSRDRILELLESNKGTYLSGADIAEHIGISRTAVWKAVKRLQNDGYSIDAVTNRGYCLMRGGDVLSESGIRSFLHHDVPGIAMDIFDTVDSTNSICLRRASLIHNAAGSGGHRTGTEAAGLSDGGIAAPYAAIAGGQTQGRGRRGRSFFSPDNTGLYMSILLHPSAITSDQAMRFTTIAAVAAAEAIEAVSSRTALIKWVNDIYVGRRKVCGILTEASFNPEDGTLDHAVVGIGINVYEPAGGFPADIKDRAGAIALSGAGYYGQKGSENSAADDMHPGASASADQMCSPDHIIERGGRNRLAAEILNRFFSYCNDIYAAAPVRGKSIDRDSAPETRVPAYVREYKKRCFVTGMNVDVIKAGSDPVRAHVLDIDDLCHLLVRYKDGSEEILSSGEISISL